MARRKRNTEVFSLSFLDVICCGFGAVVLFYTIISAQSGVERVRKVEDLTGVVNKLEEQVLEGTKNLVVLRNTLEKTDSETVSASRRATRIVEELAQRRDQASIYDKDSIAQRESVEKLKSDIRQLEESTRRLQAAATEVAPEGEKVKAFRGTGDRRYITGLRLTGKRVLVLIDTSASMMSDDIVEIIRLRNSPDAAKRSARKWNRAISTVEWLSTQLPRGSQFQVYGFNTKALPVSADLGAAWLSSGDVKAINAVLQGLRSIAPADGTSLINALAVVDALSPAPDQIVLITDGLPTQGATPPAIKKYIDARGRERLFDEAIKKVPRKVPVDVVLFPMKGDNPAAYRFWQLARTTGGSYLIPSRDWP